MRVPIRKPGQYTHLKPDQYLTEAKFNELKNKLNQLKLKRPRLAAEVKRLAEMGDFSENAAYQIAKGSLRGMNQKIIELEDHLKRALIIQKVENSTTVKLGCCVTISRAGKEKTYLILGPAETDPEKNIISYRSPLGESLMGKAVGETVKVNLADKQVQYKIIKLS